jgi:hypothetical protein
MESLPEIIAFLPARFRLIVAASYNLIIASLQGQFGWRQRGGCVLNAMSVDWLQKMQQDREMRCRGGIGDK